MNPPASFEFAAEFRRNWRWLALLASFPFIYLGLIVAPPPVGLGQDFGNDFSDHRIGWIQLDAFWLSHRQIPLWNPVDQFGVLNFGGRGMAWCYPFRWWLYIPAIWAPSLNYAAQYVQIALHMTVALWGLFFLLRRLTSASPAAAVFAATPFLLNQRFTDFVRYPQGIEAMSWIPWILFAALECSRSGATFDERKRWAWRISLGTALSLLAGYGQLTYMGALFCGIVLLCGARSTQGLLTAIGGAAIGGVAAVGSLLPLVRQAATMAGRQGGDSVWVNQFMPPGYVDTWLRPFAAEVHGSAFFPPIFLFLSCLGLVVALTNGTRRMATGMFAGLVLVADLARGSAGIAFPWFYEHAPMYHAFRIQGRNFWPVLIAVAYFSAHGLAWLEKVRRRAAVNYAACLALTLILLAIAWNATGPSVLPDRIPGYSALSNNWITSAKVGWAYAAVLVSGMISLGLILLKRTRWRGLAGIVLVAAFLLGHARFNTWMVTTRPAAAVTSVQNAYPNGVLQTYQAQPHQGVLAVWGDEETTRRKFVRYTALQPHPDALFPASRFLFFPYREDQKISTASLRLHVFDANHLDFEVRSQGPGTLIYFASPNPKWSCNLPFHSWPESEALFTAFEIPAGTTRVQLSFTPWDFLTAGVLSLYGLAWLFILATGMQINSAPAWTTQAVAAAAVLFFLVGVLGRHNLDARTLIGTSASDPFHWAEIPTGIPDK